jgi:hypothetical protein
VLYCPLRKGLFTKGREITKEGTDIIFSLVCTNCVLNQALLKMLPLTKASNIKRLKEMGLMRRELDYPYLIHFRFEDKVRCFIIGSTIN